MDELRVFLLGTFRLQIGNRELVMRPAARLLLAYLVVNRQRYHRREALAGVFWGDRLEQQARSCLNTTLWRVRRELEPTEVERGTILVSNQQGDIKFEPRNPHQIDSAGFEEMAVAALSKPLSEMNADDSARLEEAASLYVGDLVESCFDEWILHERERLRALYIDSLIRLMQYAFQHQNYSKGIDTGQRILEMDPLRERIHRHLMRLYVANGERGRAISQYEICRQILAEELNIAPMPETQATYQQIVSATTGALVPTAAEGEDDSRELGLAQLKSAQRALSQAQDRLQRAFALLNSSKNK